MFASRTGSCIGFKVSSLIDCIGLYHAMGWDFLVHLFRVVIEPGAFYNLKGRGVLRDLGFR